MRIARYLASCGLGARRQCETLVSQGRVSVNRRPIASPALNIDPATDDVRLDGQILHPQKTRCLLLNKPCGYTCSAKDRHAPRLVAELLPKETRLFTVGRLDRDSEGLIICTNDGELAERMAHPRYQVPKTYEVEVKGAVSRARLQSLLKGVKDSGERLRADAAEILRGDSGGALVRIVICEGRKREVRRMCRQLGWQVRRLTRTAIGPLSDPELPPGHWRELAPAEIQALLATAEKPRRDT